MSSIASTLTSPRCKASLVIGFCTFYLAIQVFLIARSHLVTSKHFGFWMFPETTYFRATLSRVLVDGREVRAKRGSWTVNSPIGKIPYSWQSFVTTYRLDQLETRVRSKGSFDDTLRYFQAALHHVADRIPADRSTSKLVMTIQYQRAGAPEETIVLESKPRSAALWPGTID